MVRFAEQDRQNPGIYDSANIIRSPVQPTRNIRQYIEITSSPPVAEEAEESGEDSPEESGEDSPEEPEEDSYQ
jgi:hypothetical protein